MRALVTGGAGFIGSSIASALVESGHEVRILDDLSSGFRENVPDQTEFIEGDIADPVAAAQAVDGVEVVFHDAALRAVSLSVDDPLATDRANTHGTLLLLQAARNAGVRRFISASSSSVYGGSAPIPTPETAPLNPRSPYAVSKLAGEHYCRVFAELFGLETVSLRYFNVYGPRQRPDSAYAAVVPLFIDALRTGAAPTVHGDGLQSRSFTFIDDVVAANLAVAEGPAGSCQGQSYNVTGSATHSVLDILHTIAGELGVAAAPLHTESRAGDVRHSGGDPTTARDAFGFEAKVALVDGMRRTVGWFA